MWPDVHESLIVYLRAYSTAAALPRYVAAIEQRLYIELPERRVVHDLLIRERKWPEKVRGGVATIAEVDAPQVAEIEDFEIHESYIVIRDLSEAHNTITVIGLLNCQQTTRTRA